MQDTNGSRASQGSLLDIALLYHQRGWSIIPIKAGTKEAACKRWKPFQSQRPDQKKLRRWFTRGDCGLAVICGEVSGGLVCRDFDAMEGYERWKELYPDLAATLPTVATARGRHVYFRATEQTIVKLVDGELRGNGYCLLPPSRHPDGPQYRWLVPLPDGDLPLINDVREAGFLPDVTQKAQKPQKAQELSEGARTPRKSQVMEGEEVVSAPVQAAINAAIKQTIPSGPGKRRAELFELVRRLKALPEFEKLASTEIEFLKPYLQEWWKRAKPHTSGKHPRFEQSWQDFVFAWEEARIPYGATMQGIFDKAKNAVPPQKAVERYGAGSLRALLAALCRELQRYNGNRHFYLSGGIAGPQLGVSDVHAWRWVKSLEQDNIIRTVKKHPRGSRLATEYEYLGD